MADLRSSKPVVALIGSGGKPPDCRLCDRPADIVNRPSGRLGDDYAYCAYCATAALERFDIAKGRG